MNYFRLLVLGKGLSVCCDFFVIEEFFLVGTVLAPKGCTGFRRLGVARGRSDRRGRRLVLCIGRGTVQFALIGCSEFGHFCVEEGFHLKAVDSQAVLISEGFMAQLEGKVALVTGASSGLGREFALSLAKNGANVIIAARRKQLLESLCDEINALANRNEEEGTRSGKALAIELDVSASEPVIDAAVEKAWAAFGYIDVLVNNAGTRGAVRSPLDQEESEWNTIFNTNLRGTWLMSKAVAKRLAAVNRGGSIINISSLAGLERSLLPGGLAYGISKAGVIHLSKILALELGKYNIRTNAIAAGLFRSEITNSLFEKDWLNKVATKIVPAGKWGSVDPDLTSVVLLLASDDSQYITGNTFIVDGGQSMPSMPIWSSL